jgi:hypothetical protein
MRCLSFLFGISRRLRQPFDDVPLFVRQLSPGFESSFFAARAGFSVTHIKLFFHGYFVIYLETFPRVT